MSATRTCSSLQTGHQGVGLAAEQREIEAFGLGVELERLRGDVPSHQRNGQSPNPSSTRSRWPWRTWANALRGGRPSRRQSRSPRRTRRAHCRESGIRATTPSPRRSRRKGSCRPATRSSAPCRAPRPVAGRTTGGPVSRIQSRAKSSWQAEILPPPIDGLLNPNPDMRISSDEMAVAEPMPPRFPWPT